MSKASGTAEAGGQLEASESHGPINEVSSLSTEEGAGVTGSTLVHPPSCPVPPSSSSDLHNFVGRLEKYKAMSF